MTTHFLMSAQFLDSTSSQSSELFEVNTVHMKYLLVIFFVTGCGLVNERSIYEGVRSVNKAKSPEIEPNPTQLPPYDQYEKERKEISR